MTVNKEPKKKGGKKKIAGSIKLIIPAGSATPAPPIGPALGQRGINIMEFCKAFNAKTQNMAKGTPLPTVITFYADKSFDLLVKLPPITFLLKEKIGKKSGSATPGREVLGMISRKQLREVAEEKMPDLNTRDIEAAMRLVEGSARSMGLQVVEG